MADYKIIDVPDRAPRAALYKAVIAAYPRALRVEPNGSPAGKERNRLQNGLSLFCSRYHHEQFSVHSSIAADDAIVLWVTRKSPTAVGESSLREGQVHAEEE